MASGLHRRVHGGTDLLANLSVRIEPGDLVLIVGRSGSGKSTLLDALCGYRPATQGRVLVDGRDLYADFDSLRTAIGYVPQREIMHMDLTVDEALDYAGRLRMPPGTPTQSRRARITDVLGDLGLGDRGHLRVRTLSGGELKRVSIAIELLTGPRVCFLDEPTSGLDPDTETDLMEVLRGLGEQGRTIIATTHSTRNLVLADKLLVLARGGHMAWYGPPDDAAAYFGRQAAALGWRAPPDGGSLAFDLVYSLLDDPACGSPADWSERYRRDPAHRQWVEEVAATIGGAVDIPPDRPAPVSPRQASPLRQLAILSARNLRVLVRDRVAMALMLGAPPILATTDIILTQRTMYDPASGDPSRITLSLALLVFLAMAIGAMSFMREIVKEKEVYRRERHVNLGVVPYVASKILVAVILAVYQSAAWFTVHWLAVDIPGGTRTALAMFVTLLLATLTGMIMGLVASALSPTEGAAPLLTAMLVMPQVMFSGALLPMTKLDLAGTAITTVMPARFAFEAMVSAGGHGRDVAHDPCWRLPADQRRALVEQVDVSCTCLGQNVFSACSFPGVRRFASPAVGTPEPAPPPRPSASPSPPPAPADSSAASLQAYRDAFAAYALRVAAEQQATSGYADALQRYQQADATWHSQRSAAVSGAEAWIAVDHSAFGPIYDASVAARWAAQGVVLLVLAAVLIGIQKAKDIL